MRWWFQGCRGRTDPGQPPLRIAGDGRLLAPGSGESLVAFAQEGLGFGRPPLRGQHGSKLPSPDDPLFPPPARETVDDLTHRVPVATIEGTWRILCLTNGFVSCWGCFCY